MDGTGTAAAATILLVEDDLAVIDATCMMLEASGYQVRCAVDGPEALEHVRNGFRPRVIIADYRLPGDHGVEVVRQVRASAAHDVPAIIITGDTASREVDLTRLNGMHVLRKPVQVDRFIALVEACVADGTNPASDDP